MTAPAAPTAVVIDGHAVRLDRDLVDVVGAVWHPTGYRDGRGWPLLRDLQPDESSAAIAVPLDAVWDCHGPLLPVPARPVTAVMPLHHSPARKEAA